MQQVSTDRTGRTVLAAFAAALVVTAGIPGVVAGAPAALQAADSPTPLTACGPIDEPGTYELRGNVTAPSAGDCLTVRADGVTIDGNGYAIVGNESGIGVAADGVSDLTVTNVTLTGWSTAVSATGGAENVTVRNSTITNGALGVAAFGGSTNLVVTDTHIHDLAGTGVHLRADNGHIVGNEIEATGGFAVDVAAGDGVQVSDNRINATRGGIEVTDSAGVAISGNELRSVNGTSIHLAGEGGDWRDDYRGNAPLFVAVILSPPEPIGPTEIVGNTVADGDGNGILVQSASDVTVRENRVVRSRDGIRVGGTKEVSIVNNTAVANRDDGISLAGSSWGLLDNNTARANADDGFYVVGDGATVTANLAADNGDDGLDAQNSTGVVARGNRFLDNRNDGVFFRGIVDGVIEDNEAVRNDDDGVDLRGTVGVRVVNNTVCGSGDNNLISRTGTRGTVVRNNGC